MLKEMPADAAHPKTIETTLAAMDEIKAKQYWQFLKLEDEGQIDASIQLIKSLRDDEFTRADRIGLSGFLWALTTKIGSYT